MTATSLSFRPAVVADVPTLVSLVESAYRGDESRQGWTTEADLLEGQRTDAEAVSELLARPESLVVVVEVSDEVVGCCHLERGGADHAHLGMFAVKPGLQGHGTGRRIVGEAERIAANDWGVGQMRMHVIRQRQELIAWYERLGYERTGETAAFPYGDERFGLPRRDDLEFVVLAKTLVPASGETPE